eukprot:Sspe_Gene.69366::Locus_40888_Transcript_1_1_Confidence_1.000_Length_560::g.69366::m.69366
MLFKYWLVVLGLYELIPLVQILQGSRVHELAPGFFPTKQSDEFHLWYMWFLCALMACRLQLAFDITNYGVLRINTVLHVAEACMFVKMYLARVPLSTLSEISKADTATIDSTVITFVTLLNAVLFTTKYLAGPASPHAKTE